MSAFAEVPVIDVTAGIDFTVISCYDHVMLASADVYDVVSFFKSEEVVGKLPEVVNMIISAHRGMAHVLSVLSIEPDLLVTSQNKSEELAMDNFLIVGAGCRDFDVSEFLFLFIHALSTKTSTPDLSIATD